MNDGLALAARYSYPPNSLSLCGPSRQNDLSWYTASQQSDNGTREILQQFSTLYPYLCFIAGENSLKNPFEKKVIEAYWLGNSLLNKTTTSDFIHFLDDALAINKKITKKDSDFLKKKVTLGAMPHHAFHVLNIYRRTGHLDIPQTIETMDACIINWGTVVAVTHENIIVDTTPLQRIEERLSWGPSMKRKLRVQGEKDTLAHSLKRGDIVSYHWGYFCEKLSISKRNNLRLYNARAIHFANQAV